MRGNRFQEEFEGPGSSGGRGGHGGPGRRGGGPGWAQRMHHPGFGGPGGPFGPEGFRGWPFEGFRGGGPRGFGRGGRRPKGDVRAAVLVLLAEGPSNGYRIIGEVTRRSEGAWKPSPGSVYPTLQQLQDEGLVAADPADAKQFTLTDAGRAYVESELADAPPPWEQAEFPGGAEFGEVFKQLGQIGMLLQQVRMTGRPADVKRASDVLEKARRDLVGILAEDLREQPEG